MAVRPVTEKDYAALAADASDHPGSTRTLTSDGKPAEPNMRIGNWLQTEMAMRHGGNADVPARASSSMAVCQVLCKAVHAIYQRDYALGCLSPSNRLRQAAQAVRNWVWFDRIVLILIITNCLFLALDDPLCDEQCAKERPIAVVAKWAEIVFTIAFTIELVLNVLALGFVLNPNAYLMNPWAWIDFVCVLTSYTIFLPQMSANVTGLRALRALRPLRTIKSMPGMRLLVSTLLESLPLMIDVLFLMCWMFAVFGILGLQMFMGKLHARCWAVRSGEVVIASGGDPSSLVLQDAAQDLYLVSVPDDLNEQFCSSSGSVGSYACPQDHAMAPLVCAGHDGRASSPNPNYGYTSYDNFGAASLHILMVLTLESWTEQQMYYYIDAVGYPASVIFYVCLVLFGALFATNLLTAIISAKFSALHGIASNFPNHAPPPSAPRRRIWQALRKVLGWCKTVTTVGNTSSFNSARACFSPVSAWLRRVIEHPWFGHFIMGAILVNTLLMAMEFHNMGATYAGVLEVMNEMLTYIFIAEFAIKHLALGIVGYWSQGWNVLDGGIVIVSIMEIGLGNASSGLSALRTFRLLRVLRSAKLLRQFRTLRTLMKLVVQSFLDMKDFLLLLCLFLFIFAILGMGLFGGAPAYETAPNPRANFTSLLDSFYVVFEALAGSNWPDMLYIAMQVNSLAAVVYFVAWILTGHFVLLTLFLAILITKFQFGATRDDEEGETGMSQAGPEQVDHFVSPSRASASASAMKRSASPARDKDAQAPANDPADSSSLIEISAPANETVPALRPQEEEQQAEDAATPHIPGAPSLPWDWTVSGGTRHVPESALHAKALHAVRVLERVGYSDTAINAYTAKVQAKMARANMSAVNIVKPLRMWLLMIGHPYGIPGWEVEAFTEELDELYLSYDENSAPTAPTPKARRKSVFMATKSPTARSMASTQARSTASESRTPTVPELTLASPLDSAPADAGAGAEPLGTPSAPEIQPPSGAFGSPATPQPWSPATPQPWSPQARDNSATNEPSPRSEPSQSATGEIVELRVAGIASRSLRDNSIEEGEGARGGAGAPSAPCAPVPQLKRAPSKQQQQPQDVPPGHVIGSDDDRTPREEEAPTAPPPAALSAPPRRGRRSSVEREPAGSAVKTPAQLQAAARLKEVRHQRQKGVAMYGAITKPAPKPAPPPAASSVDMGRRRSSWPTAEEAVHASLVSLLAPELDVGDEGHATVRLPPAAGPVAEGAGNNDASSSAGPPVSPRRVPSTVSQEGRGTTPEAGGRERRGSMQGRGMRKYESMRGLSKVRESSPSFLLSGLKQGTPWHSAYEQRRSQISEQTWQSAAALESSSFKKAVSFQPQGVSGLDGGALQHTDSRARTSRPSAVPTGSRISSLPRDFMDPFANASETLAAEAAAPTRSLIATLSACKEEETSFRELASAKQRNSSSKGHSVRFDRNLSRSLGADSAPGQHNEHASPAASPPQWPDEAWDPARVAPVLDCADADADAPVTEEADDLAHVLEQRPLGFFPKASESELRRAIVRVALSRRLEYSILLCIVLSSVLLAVDSPFVDSASPFGQFLSYSDMVFTIIFTVELVIKVLALGLVRHPGSYLRNSWNQLDFIIVITSLLSLAFNSGALDIFRVIRLMRTLRPLRMISRLRNMQLVVNTLIASIPSVLNIVLFGLFEFGVFSILGVQLFSGQFYRCNDEIVDYADGTQIEVMAEADCIPGTFICEEGDLCEAIGDVTERQWINFLLNFDHIGNAMLTLFTISTLDDFMQIGYRCMDARGVGYQPKKDHNKLMAMYVVLFVFLGGFFWVNLLVGVIIDQYTRMMENAKQTGGAFLMSAKQAEWLQVIKFKPTTENKWDSVPRPTSSPLGALYDLMSHRYFEAFILACIILNILCMVLISHGQSATKGLVLDMINLVFTLIFILEAIGKIAIMRFGPYIAENWNKLDLVIVLMSLPELVMFFMGTSAAGLGGFTVFRIFRVGRLFKLVKGAKGLRMLFNTLIMSVPAIFNVGSLLFLVMFVYGVLGMNLFGLEPNFDGSRTVNFHSFGNALLLLFRVFTGDAWAQVMVATAGCDSNGYNCDAGKTAVSAIFFCSFVVIASFVMLNLVIAVIVDNFVESVDQSTLVKEHDFCEVVHRKIVLNRFLNSLLDKLGKFRKGKLNWATREAPSVVRSKAKMVNRIRSALFIAPNAPRRRTGPGHNTNKRPAPRA